MSTRTRRTLSLHTIDDVNAALREIGSVDCIIADIEARYDTKAAALKASREDALREIAAERQILAEQVLSWIERRRDEALPDGRKSRDLYWGKIGFRQSTKVEIPDADAAIAAAQAHGLDRLLVPQPPRLDRAALRHEPAEVLQTLGVSVWVEDNPFLAPDVDKIRKAVTVT